MANPHSDRKLLICKRCKKSKTSPARAMFFGEIKIINNDDYIVLVCRNCRKLYFFKAIPGYGAGQIKHCYFNRFKVETSNLSIICICGKCKHRTYFKLFKEEVQDA